MENKNEILQELASISPMVAGIEKKQIFFVPDGYFNGLAGEIMMLVGPEPQMNVPRSMYYQVPQDYFKNFADTVMQKIAEDASAEKEIASLSPLLASLRSRPTYAVSEDYFNAIDEKIEQVTATTKAKVVSMQNRKPAWMRYAVAAAVTTIVGFTGYFSYTSFGEKAVAATDTNVEERISNVPDEELYNYVISASSPAELASIASETQDVERILNTVNEQEIKDYLKENSGLEELPVQGI